VRRTTILALSMLSLGALLPVACTQNFGFFEATASSGPSTGGATGTSSSAHSSSHSSAASSSSGAGGAGCTDDTDCDDQNACTTDACTSGKCANTAVADGPVPGFVDMVKDCKTQACMSGVVTTIADDADVPASSGPCVTVTCMNQVAVMGNVMLGQSCGAMQSCDGKGNCVGCNNDSDCAPAGTCQTAHCTNNACENDNDAPGTQCNTPGGKVCDGSGNCVGCVGNGDCTSGNCQNNNTCGLANNGHPCTNGGQCATNHCVDLVCCNHTCNGMCMGCTAALTGQTNDGICGNVLKGTAPVPPSQCTAAPPCGNDGTCDGNAKCEVAASGTACGSVMCTGDMLTAAGTCDGMSACVPGSPTNCDPYTCSGTSCRTSCTVGSATDCSVGNYCAAGAPPSTTGTCVPLVGAGGPCTLNIQCLNGMCVTVDGGGKACN